MAATNNGSERRSPRLTAAKLKPCGRHFGHAWALASTDVFLEGVDVRNATLDYEDRSAKSRTKVSEFNANIGSVLSGELTPFSLSGVLQSSGEHPIKCRAPQQQARYGRRFTADGNVSGGPRRQSRS